MRIGPFEDVFLSGRPPFYVPLHEQDGVANIFFYRCAAFAIISDTIKHKFSWSKKGKKLQSCAMSGVYAV